MKVKFGIIRVHKAKLWTGGLIYKICGHKRKFLPALRCFLIVPINKLKS